MYTYFITLNYFISEGFSAIGNTEITIGYKITSIDQIRNIAKAIEYNQGIKNVIVTNFILLREEL